MDHSEKGRRDFLKSLALGAAGAAMLSPQSAQAAAGGTLQVWSCGGLAEAMMPAHAAYAQQSGVKIVYTGAFAAALGKSLLTGGGQTLARHGLQDGTDWGVSGAVTYVTPLGLIVQAGLTHQRDQALRINQGVFRIAYQAGF